MLLLNNINHPAIWLIPPSLFAFAFFGYKYNKKITENLTATATVIAKTIQPHKTYTEYFVSFELTDKTRINLTADVDRYNAITENETGTLHYQKIKDLFHLVDFIRN